MPKPCPTVDHHGQQSMVPVSAVEEKLIHVQYIEPIDDMKVFDAEDAQLNLASGTPRFYIMRFVVGTAPQQKHHTRNVPRKSVVFREVSRIIPSMRADYP